VQRHGQAYPVDADLPTTAELLTSGLGRVRATASATAGGVPAERLSLRSPATSPCRVVAQAVNYRSHADDTFSRTPSAAVRNERKGTSRLLGTSR
jgi:hypothetical protein